MIEVGKKAHLQKKNILYYSYRFVSIFDSLLLIVVEHTIINKVLGSCVVSNDDNDGDGDDDDDGGIPQTNYRLKFSYCLLFISLLLLLCFLNFIV